MIKAHRQLLGKNIVSNSEIFYRKQSDAQSFNSLSDPLGDRWLSRSVEFLIRAELITLEQGRKFTSYEEVTDVIANTFHVIAANRRSAIFRLKDFTLSIDQYGTIRFPINHDYPVKGIHSEDTTWCASFIKEVMMDKGVAIENLSNNGKPIYNFTALQKSIKPNQKGFVLINEDVSGNYHVGSSDGESEIEVEFFTSAKEAAKERRDIVKSTGNKDFIVRRAKLTDNASRLIVYCNPYDDKTAKVLLLKGDGKAFYQAVTLDALASNVA